jgi:hypothetical protein
MNFFKALVELLVTMFSGNLTKDFLYMDEPEQLELPFPQ